MASPWDDGLERQVKNLWLEGMSAREIAITISTPTQRYSRNAVIGKISRLCLSRETPSPAARARAVARIVAPPKPPKAVKPPKPPAPPREPPAASPPVVAPAPLDLSHARRLRDLNTRECHFPLDDPGPGEMHRTLFCGAPIGVTDTCCHHHTRLAWRERPEPRQKRSA